MPRRLTKTKDGTHQALKNTAYESLVIHWLMQDGWQVFIPMLDHGHKTDILISDGPNYHRVQIKTVDAKSEDHVIKNMWGEDSGLDVVVYFARNSTWGYVFSPFDVSERKLNHKDHRRFQKGKNEFLKEFHKIENRK